MHLTVLNVFYYTFNYFDHFLTSCVCISFSVTWTTWQSTTPASSRTLTQRRASDPPCSSMMTATGWTWSWRSWTWGIPPEGRTESGRRSVTSLETTWGTDRVWAEVSIHTERGDRQEYTNWNMRINYVYHSLILINTHMSIQVTNDQLTSSSSCQI